jgi:hypothetical protein
VDSVQNNSHVYRKCHLRRREGIVACLVWTASQATVEILLAFISLLISASRTFHILVLIFTEVLTTAARTRLSRNVMKIAGEKQNSLINSWLQYEDVAEINVSYFTHSHFSVPRKEIWILRTLSATKSGMD